MVHPRGFVELDPRGRGERLVGGYVQSASALKVGFQGACPREEGLLGHHEASCCVVLVHRLVLEEDEGNDFEFDVNRRDYLVHSCTSQRDATLACWGSLLNEREFFRLDPGAGRSVPVMGPTARSAPSGLRQP